MTHSHLCSYIPLDPILLIWTEYYSRKSVRLYRPHCTRSRTIFPYLFKLWAV
jgi:hypothetical protein